MLLTTENMILVIVILEVFLVLDSVLLGITAKKTPVKIIQYVMAALWAVCAIMNLVNNIL